MEDQAKLIAMMNEWASLQARADNVAKGVEILMREIGEKKLELPTQYGKAVARFSGNKSYDWGKIAMRVLGDDYEEIAEKYATPIVDWEATARAVAPSEKALQQAVAANTTYQPPHWGEKLLASYVDKRTLAEAKEEFSNPPKKVRFVLELKPLK